jgi:ATP-dependent Lon protease
MLSVGCVGEETLNTALFFGKEEEMSNTIERPSIVLPILAMRGLVMFPDMSLQFDVGRSRSIKAVREAVNVPVIASGGAGSAEDFVTLFKEIPDMDAGLAASIFHFGEVSIAALKQELAREGITVRLSYAEH